jgi:hypothetical protein
MASFLHWPAARLIARPAFLHQDFLDLAVRGAALAENGADPDVESC